MPDVTLVSATLGEDRSVEPPIGPLYIANALEIGGRSVDFRDYQLMPGANAFDVSSLVAFMEGHSHVLMISCFVDMLPLVLEASRQLKLNSPNTVIILGGPGPTAGAAKILEAFPQIDGIVQGEGEATVIEWCLATDRHGDAWCEHESIPGLVYRTRRGVIDGGPRRRISEQIDDLEPAYHLIDWNQYTGARVVTTRGCPYHCAFCDVAPLWGRRAVYRSISRTVDEMISLRDAYGQREFAIVDDTFVLNRHRVERFCRELIDRQANLTWGCFGRINLMSERLIATMREAGCRSIFYGIDSGSQRILDETVKEIRVEAILPTLETSAQYFDTIEASFIWGYPNETVDDFTATLRLAAEASKLAPIVNVQLHMLSPLPSAPITNSFDGELRSPLERDRRWLLLPALLLDKRAGELRNVVLTHKDLFPGFFTFPTIGLDEKRQMLEEIFDALHRTLGQVVLDKRARQLLVEDDRETELRLFTNADADTAKIGTGLALGMMRRARRNRAVERCLTRLQRVGVTRERNDLGGRL